VIMDSERRKPSAMPTLFTAKDLMERDLPPIEEIVKGLVFEGVTLFAGKPKLGKTWLMLALALAIAMGSVILGNIPVQQGEVLYLALEDNPRRLYGRIRKLLAGRETPAGLTFASEWPRLDEGGLEKLDAFLSEHPDVRLVICDTFARIKPRATGRRAQYDEDRDAVDSLIPLADKHGVAMVLVHHLREAESDDPLDMIHGSAGLTGGVDGALVLKRRRGEADAYLFGDGRDYENTVELALKWNVKAATWSILGDAEAYAMSEQRRSILGVLQSADEPLGPKQITARLNANGTETRDGAIREMCSQMANDGQIRNLGRGRYVARDHKERSPDNPDTADKLT
jgi:hypothetical protein